MEEFVSVSQGILNMSNVIQFVITVVMAFIAGRVLHKDTAADYKYGVDWLNIFMISLLVSLLCVIGLFVEVHFAKGADDIWIYICLVAEVVINVLFIILYCDKKIKKKGDKTDDGFKITYYVIGMSEFISWVFFASAISRFLSDINVKKISFETINRIVSGLANMFILYMLIGIVFVFLMIHTNRYVKYDSADIEFIDESHNRIHYSNRAKSDGVIIFETKTGKRKRNRESKRIEINASTVKQITYYKDKT